MRPPKQVILKPLFFKITIFINCDKSDQKSTQRSAHNSFKAFHGRVVKV